MTAGEARQVLPGQAVTWGTSSHTGKVLAVDAVAIKVRWDDGMEISYRYDARWFHMLHTVDKTK